MSASPPSPRPLLVLVGDAHEWSARSLESILSPRGYRIRTLHTSPELLAAAAHESDAVILQTGLSDRDVLGLIRALRGALALHPEIPVVLTATGPLSRARRLGALRAGASDVWGLPMDADEVILRLEALLRARVAAARARDEGLVDAATGFYNQRGVVRRGDELAALAARRRTAIGCIVVAPAGTKASEARTRSRPDPAVAAIAQGLKGAARTTDVVGRIGPTQFAVLAPEADAQGARKLASRAVLAIRWVATTRPPDQHLEVCAGYHGVDDFSASGLCTRDLLARATSAVRAAEASGRDGAIRGFRPGPQDA